MKSLLFSSLIISLALFLGRLSGFVRELVLAARFGASEQADVAVLLLTLPDFMVGLLLAGGFNAAFIPAMKRENPIGQAALFLKMSMFVGVLFGFLALLMILFPELPFRILAPSLSPHAITENSRFLQFTMLALPLAALSGVSVGYLNVNGKFFLPGLGTLIFNAVIIAYLLAIFSDPSGLIGLALVIVLAAALRLVSQIAPILRKLRAVNLSAARIDGQLFGQFITGVIAYSLIASVLIIFRTLYATGGAGNLALFNYSQKLFELPAVLLLAPAVTVLLPKFSNLYDKRDTFQGILNMAYGAIIAVSSIAIAVGLIFGDRLAMLIYFHGTMTQTDVSEIATISKILFMALPFLGSFQITAAALNALKQTKLVLRNTTIALVSVLLMFALLRFVGRDTMISILWLFIVFYVLVAALNAYTLREFLPAPRYSFWRNSIRILAVTAVCAAPFSVIMRYLPSQTNTLWVLGLTALCSVVMLLAHRRLFKPLLRIRAI